MAEVAQKPDIVVSSPSQIDVKLFNRWSFDDIQLSDVSLSDYIGAAASKHAAYNPIEVIVAAIVNNGPREDAARIGFAGVVRRQAVDISPLRRVNQANYLISTGAREAAYDRRIGTLRFF
ncbi:hypothetical protein KIW84_043756 [Lathyrus oleraceus]|uniref:Small ribosomal subunit protein uS7 domain-containing protein n=1 Tax=Pisum sativum TaxID=3888 RepID=A0A9D5AUZ3_PEA|nr:hypothetical protein KIW84_043756 [Pisum sativum]